jgi:hypothetical protein
MPSARSSNKKTEAPPIKKVVNFTVMSQGDVPHGRNGKHKGIVTRIMEDLDGLEPGNAIRIRLDELPDSKEKVRAALSRALRQKNIDVVTSTDSEHLYIWHSAKNRNGKA